MRRRRPPTRHPVGHNGILRCPLCRSTFTDETGHRRTHPPLDRWRIWLLMRWRTEPAYLLAGLALAVVAALLAVVAVILAAAGYLAGLALALAVVAALLAVVAVILAGGGY